MKVIGTAGHIDHGKSTLVHRLTGIDPDRLSEEKSRGMTIDLGFAWLTLPSGGEVSIVDVPGHERFVKNMLAGAGGIDVALLVVAADEAVMPQTREHLDILHLLGVRQGVVALTKVDLVDEDLRELAAAEVRELLTGTSLDGSPVVGVSAVSGEGVNQLLEALDCAVGQAPDPEDSGRPFLPIDRVFTVSGFGTVLTGTLLGGALRIGDEVEIAPSSTLGRVRNLQTHRRWVETAGPGSRVAVNVAGISRHHVERGDVLSRPGLFHGLQRLDAQLQVLPDAPFPLRHGLSVSVHVGAAERVASLGLLQDESIAPGEVGWAQLRFSEPVVAFRGQRFIVRLPAPARTVAGGLIADLAPRHRRRDPQAVRRLQGLTSGEPERMVLAALPPERPASTERLAGVVGLTPAQVQEVLDGLQERGLVAPLGRGYMASGGWKKLADRVRDDLARYHAEHPLRRGMPKEELRRKLGWPPGEPWSALLASLESSGRVREDGSVVALPGHFGGTASSEAEAGRLLQLLEGQPFSPPGAGDLLRIAGSSQEVLSALAEEQRVVRLSDDIVLARTAYDRMVAGTLDLIRSHGTVTVAELRDAFQTSRKYALAFLEHLDSQRITRRAGDARVLGSKAPG